MSEMLPVQKTLSHFEQATKEGFSADPYLDTVAIVFNWKVGNTDLPFGLLLGRDGSVDNPTSLVGISGQTSKMLMHQAAQINQMFEAADLAAAELAQRLNALKEQIDELTGKQVSREDKTQV
jgi:hypothetical protein